MENNYEISYTTINHNARLELGLTCIEYVFLDTVCNLSNNPLYDRWCFASKTKLAGICNISEQHIHRLIKKFTNMKDKNGNDISLLEKDPKTKNIRTTIRWYEFAIIKKELIQKYKEDRKGKNTSPRTGATSEGLNDPATKIKVSNGKTTKDLAYFMGRYHEINPFNFEKFFKVKSYRDDEQFLLDNLGADRLDALHDMLPKINKTPFIPHSYTPSEVRRNYPKYLDHAVMKTAKRTVRTVT